MLLDVDLNIMKVVVAKDDACSLIKMNGLYTVHSYGFIHAACYQFARSMKPVNSICTAILPILNITSKAC